MNFTEDRNTEEPHIQSSGSLSKLLKDLNSWMCGELNTLLIDSIRGLRLLIIELVLHGWTDFMCQNVLVIE